MMNLVIKALEIFRACHYRLQGSILIVAYRKHNQNRF